MSLEAECKQGNPFVLSSKPAWLARALEWLLGLSRLARIYDRREPEMSTPAFLRYTLNSLNVTVENIDAFHVLDGLPKTGPLLVTANHPLGGLEGVALASELLKYRPDTKVLTNELLTRIPELASIFVGVDILSGAASRQNVSAIRALHKHLGDGGCLLIFPAGKVASFDIKKRSVIDHDWNRLVGHLVNKSGATVMPVYVEGWNSKLFYALALVHPLLRTLCLPRELSNKQNFVLRLIYGQTVAVKELINLGSPEAITDYLRLTTELLKPSAQQKKRYSGVKTVPLAQMNNLKCDAITDTASLSDYLLIGAEDFDVYCAPFNALGEFAERIGLARELTFREAGEGTGHSIDIDQFDAHYMHLFVWDKLRGRVAGGYRIGKVDEIVASHGIEGLYSRTLYSFNEAYLKKLGNALEIGRSFVHPEYQRQSRALDLLWRGIGLFVAQNPDYHTLFGAVSISNEHSDLARALIAETMLQSFRAEQRFLEDVKPVVPLKVSGRVWTDEMLASLTHVSLVNKLIGRCDPGKALPTLLRHYLSLNGRFVCFSVNKVFNNSLDGLIIVDLRLTPRRYLNRYLGKEQAANFIEQWSTGIEQQKTA